MARDEIGNEILLLTRPARRRLEALGKNLEASAAGLLHQVENAITHVLGRDLQVSADVMSGQFVEVFRLVGREIHPNP